MLQQTSDKINTHEVQFYSFPALVRVRSADVVLKKSILESIRSSYKLGEGHNEAFKSQVALNEHEIEPIGSSTTYNKADFTLVGSDYDFNEGKDASTGDENTLNEAVSTSAKGHTTWVS